MGTLLISKAGTGEEVWSRRGVHNFDDVPNVSGNQGGKRSQ